MELLLRIIKYFNRRSLQTSSPSSGNRAPARGHVHSQLKANIEAIRAIFSKAPDMVMRSFFYRPTESHAVLVYFDGLADKNSINNNVLYQLMFESEDIGVAKGGRLGKRTLPLLPVTLGHITTISSFDQFELAILHGKSVLFIDGVEQAYAFNTQGWPQRAISDSQIEASLKGAHQGFIETSEMNVALIRRYISSRELKIKELSVGSRVASKLSILYLEDVTEPELLAEMERRLTSLNVDCILNTGELAELIEDNPFSLLPQFITTERPDTAASQILQGRLCVIVDRSSSVLIAPAGIAAFFQGIDDYSTRWPVATFMRLLRFFACFLAAFLPGIYIACISFNHEVIPLDLILSIGQFRAAVPFPPLIEALIMEITLEMLREAGIRLPAPVGQTVGIVGGIVIGQAAVQAGIVSNLMVVVVSSTAVASFILPNYDMASAIRLIRFPVMLIASMFGIVGIIVAFMVLIAHLISLTSLSEPFSVPIAPIRISDWKDVFVRLPLWKMTTRPRSVRSLQKKRMGSNRSDGENK
ncbi:spore germination protein [Paenibacillus montanisoli]|uniref:Spore germination protein n=1 Tax=Paenibacillus montanisoli TaxID=2081970 RepID=A0A328U742_9BACL|nr:spore germination protein [Paenibacillus montanisoli]RAP78379.1 spore germination protein [Paenibacillus montanisoli]